MKRTATFLSALLVSTGLLAKPQYVDLKPLADVVRTPVAEVKTTGQTVVPLITWGGDIATVHANGNSRKTQNSSIFDAQGLDLQLQREDAFTRQLENYLSGKTPYLRGTMGMINSAGELLGKDARTKPVVIYQMTWSSGGDALVVKNNIKTAKDLKGKTIAIQAYGPHVDYATRVLQDAGLSFQDVNIKWLPDLTGTDDAPMAALYESDVDAAFVIIPDALALTSGGTVGTGAEDSVAGAEILLSTKTANRVIADVYAVRSDYFQSNRANVEAFVSGLMKGAEATRKVVSDRNSDQDAYRKLVSASGDILLDSPNAIADVEGLYADAEFVFFNGNVKFFTDANYPRRFDRLNSEINSGLQSIGALRQPVDLAQAGWSYAKLQSGLAMTTNTEAPRFKESEVAQMVTRRQQQNSLSDGELFSFEVFFQPNQNQFSGDLYSNDFKRVVDLASTYGGAIITVEGHSDPMGYLRAKKSGDPSVVLGRIKQSAKNLSLTRAQSVRDSIINYAQDQSVSLDPSQFAIVGHGITQPSTGVCGSDPCAPKTKEEWLSNMKVEFRIIQVEAESDVFQPL